MSDSSLALKILEEWYQRGSITDDERGELKSIILRMARPYGSAPL